MDPLQRLGIRNITDDDIHSAFTRFAMKFEKKAERATDQRISRF